MNGEIHQICSIVAAGKKAIQSGDGIKYIPSNYENTISFSFLPEKKILRKKSTRHQMYQHGFSICWTEDYRTLYFSVLLL